MLSEAQATFLGGFLDRNSVWEGADEVLRLSRFYLHDQLKVLEDALHLLDGKETIKCFDSCVENGFIARSYWKVPSSKNSIHYNESYMCMETGCTCRSYHELARAADASLTPMCKHLLAVRLGTALGVIEYSASQSEEAFSKDITQAQMQSLAADHHKLSTK